MAALLLVTFFNILVRKIFSFKLTDFSLRILELVPFAQDRIFKEMKVTPPNTNRSIEVLIHGPTVRSHQAKAANIRYFEDVSFNWICSCCQFDRNSHKSDLTPKKNSNQFHNFFFSQPKIDGLDFLKIVNG